MCTRVFFCRSFTLATLDDDLYGTRAVENQVKTLSARKVDREGHTADVIADELFKITLGIRFRRRGEGQHENVQKLLTHMLEGRTGQSLCGFTITADCGYGSLKLIEELNKQGVSAIFVMPGHVLRCHPFVGLSYLSSGTADDCEEGQLQDSNMAGEGDGSAFDGSILDRPEAFVIKDDASCGPDVVAAVKKLRTPDGETRSRRQVVAIAVRERPTTKFCKAIRFLYSVPPHISSAVDTWLAVPKSETTSHLLFNDRSEHGEVEASAISSDEKKASIESFLLQHCNVKTIGQRCADWFLLRQFRVTGTSAGQLLLSDSSITEQLGISSAEEIEPALEDDKANPTAALKKTIAS